MAELQGVNFTQRMLETDFKKCDLLIFEERILVLSREEEYVSSAFPSSFTQIKLPLERRV